VEVSDPRARLREASRSIRIRRFLAVLTMQDPGEKLSIGDTVSLLTEVACIAEAHEKRLQNVEKILQNVERMVQDAEKAFIEKTSADIASLKDAVGNVLDAVVAGNVI